MCPESGAASGASVAALYDVHGNVPALEAVLAEVGRAGVDKIVFGGDLASGPLPRETVELARSLDAVYVRGNADRLDSPAMSPEWDAARRWVDGQLDEEQIAWLANLDFSAVIDDTLYVHATPQDDETVVTELTSDERLAELLAEVDQALVVAGHTHMQIDRRVGGKRFVNAGSVGMPYEREPGAYWALISDDIELRRTEYDLERAAAAIRASGHPMAEELAAENVLTIPSREEALAAFGG
ncbi:MAG: metallophosphoesterase family protein [Actinobacteria bacterium]|nr:metallophosphoesterase family protein [Actinomycetota bacterium]